MSSKQQVARRAAADEQQLSQPQVEAREQYASAEAKAGLNLNIFAALSGSMFQRSKKTTDTAADGSSRTVEHTDTAAQAKGAGHGNLSAVGSAKAESRDRAVGNGAIEAVGESQKKIKGAKKQQQKQVEEVDHLGIGAWEK
ncbi:membrane protein [Neofusicoccum parvum]|uniref:Uncharacterized protein n=2 Tax=Neofusicoccum parvum TaxID=310453 RepID=R1H284_BOTPV|nr:hypothetical protein UCRNP2_692 [Neofusicoccum parvum UCRNP2]GME23575.1 membrane protein [Neofusicoccum parvum]GME56474.1 membrane protein [Neofusicoccum parvum]